MPESAGLFYLFAPPHPFPGGCDTDTVFCRVKVEALAESICDSLKKEYTGSDGLPLFEAVRASGIPTKQQKLLDQSLRSLPLDGDPGLGKDGPIPQEDMPRCAKYAVWATRYEFLLSHDVDLSSEDRRNGALNLLFRLAQAYYMMLECVVGATGNWVCLVDPGLNLDLNGSYVWVTRRLLSLLKNHPELCGFPVEFHPRFPNVYPSTVRDCDWNETVGPEAERFIATVQEYVEGKGIHDPEEGSRAWVFVEMFRGGIETAVRRVEAYRKEVQKSWRDLLQSASPDDSGDGGGSPSPSPESGNGTTLEGIHADVREIRKSTSGLPESITNLEQGVESVRQNTEAIAANEYELQQENAELQRIQDEGFLGFAKRVPPQDFIDFIFILALGNRKQAADALQVPFRTFYDRVGRWAHCGALHRRMLLCVEWRKKVGRKIKVRIPDSILGTETKDLGENPDTKRAVLDVMRDRADAVDHEDLCREILQALKEQTSENWPELRDELVEILKYEVPQ